MKESQKIARKIHSTKFIRNVSGAKNPRAILDENKVLSIRQLISDGHKPIEIAASYGISYGTVMAIKFNKICGTFAVSYTGNSTLGPDCVPSLN